MVLTSVPVCTDAILSTLCTCKSNTASLSQEIITAISSLVCSLAAAVIGWNYFRKQLSAAPRGALKLSQRLAGTRGRQPVPVCKHYRIPPVSLSQCLQSIRHISFVSTDSDSLTQCTFPKQLQLHLHSHPDSPELPDQLSKNTG